MAMLNKVMLIGRLAADPEFRAFGNGGRVANLRLAVNGRKKDSTGAWVDDPMFIDCSVFNRGENGKEADRIEEFGLRKGSQLYIEGKLVLEMWDDKATGAKRSKHKMIVDNWQTLDPKSQQAAPQRPAATAPRAYTPPEEDNYPPPEHGQGDDQEIPF